MRGTPIKATGNGRVKYVGRKGGYGRVIIVQHGPRYTTLYAHLRRYASGIHRGSIVKLGQTIGYVGSSGMSTGPHLHYEFRINGVHRNPITVTLPKARPIAKKYRKDFLNKAQVLLSQLENKTHIQVAQTQ
ncbi:M23 family metallopeptidase [Piscirickettsia litoralis]|uniref:M23 family metallopeptidase n=1 Tax=Piscirickettsia litoralis TaxID=1891921 RepID=UPI000AAD1366|nr:M23 family metallopeptidase [Piscirickettsia litoralis]